MEAPLIEFRGVTKRFGENTVLDKVDLKIYEGHITTLIGKSGTGKSVLIKHIIGLLKPDGGSILFRGVPVEKLKKGEWDAYRSRISYMFQNNALFDSMTVFGNIALPLKETTNLGDKEIEKKVMGRIEQTELSDVAFKYPSELSGGMQKRVALARALVTDPQIVLFDEPTTGQDPVRKNSILTMIAQYKKKFGFTAIIISHDIPDIFFISDRILLLWEGRIAFQGTYEESARFEHPMVEEFMQSLEGFQDALTGLLSKQTFRARYESVFGRRFKEKTITAVLFSVELERLCGTVGHEAALKVIKALGKYVSRNFDALGGFSARQSMDHILTILPHADINEAREMLDGFAGSLREFNLCDVEGGRPVDVNGDACFEIDVFAGITEGRSNDKIENIIERAKSRREVVAQYRCETGGGIYEKV
jgi:phospholipid/cholesterol/gamma-HCH transport system ATP-binding protein